MSETYAVKAVLSAVDNGLISTMDKAVSSLNGITKKSDIFGNSAGNSFRRASESARDFTSSVAKLATAIGITQAVSAGINAMKNSMGAAVSRMDTLNNSSRVFKNMGFAAEDTSKMMDKLQDSIKGLPTPLDEAVKGVQMIASSTGDIGKSQEIWSALNDSILGFGGSTADVNNAVLQLSQAFSNGKIDGMTWISMMNSQMGPVLSAIAKQLGLTTGQLRDGLASGKISVQQFQDALIELDKNGGGGLASLHQIALTATGGISTSMQNAKTSVVRGLTEMIQSFDTFSQSVTGLSLSQIITQIGTAVEGVLDRVAATIPKAADYFKNLGLTANQSKGLITGFVTAAMGIGALVALAPVIGSVVTAFGGLFSIVGKVTNVFSGLVGFLVTPWGAAAVAIGLVVVVLADLYATFQPFHDAINNTVSAFIQGFRQSIPAAIQAVKSVLDTLKNDLNIIGQAIQEQIGGSLKSIDIQTFQSMFTTAFQSIGSAIQIVINTLTQVIQGFIQVGALQSIWRAIGAVIGAIGGIIGGVIDAINNLIGTSGSVNSTQNIWQTLGTVIGNIINVIASVIIQISKIIKSISAMSGVITPLTGSVIAFIAAFKGISIAISLINTLKKALIVGEVIKGTIGDINLLKFALTNMAGESKLAAAAQTILNGVMAINPFVLIAAAIAAVVTALTLFFAKTQTGQQIWQQFTTFLSGVWNGLVSTAQTVFNGLASFFSNLWNGIVSTATSVWNGITGTLSGIWNGIVSTAQPIFQGLANFLSGLWNGIKDIAQGAWEAIKSVIMGPVLILIDLVTGDFKHLQSDLELIWNSIKSAASSIWNGIKTIFTTITTGIKNTIVNIWNGAKSLIINIWNGLKATGSNIVNAIKSIWTNGFNALKNFVVNVANAMVNGAKNAWNGLKSAANWIVDQVRRAFDALRHIDLVAAGKAIINSFLNGLKAAFKGVKNWIGGIGDWIRKHKGPIQYDRKLLIPAGNAIMQGLNFGLVSAFKDVQGNVSNMAKSIAEAANNNLSSNLNNINAKLANGTINHAVSGQLEIQQQPAYIQLQMGDNTFNAYVDDITKQQNISLDLGRF